MVQVAHIVVQIVLGDKYQLIKKCCVKIPLFEDIVIIIMGNVAITATKLNEQELTSAELCRQCCILNLLSLDGPGVMP